MRLWVLLACCILLSGCVEQQEKKPEAAEIQPTVYFSEDFSSGAMGGWTVGSAGGASMTVVKNKMLGIDNAVELRSQGFRSATAKAPEFSMDYSKDYAVSFDFMLRHSDNYGLTVYEDRNVKLVLEHGTGIACLSGGETEFLGRIDNNRWHKIAVEVGQEYGGYDVYIDRELKRTCDMHRGSEETFTFGDPDPADKTYGDGLWDNFRVADRL